jgi:hypothetical protein
MAWTLISRARATASSRAKGMPSRRSQIWPTAATPGSSRTKPGRAVLALSMNNLPALSKVTSPSGTLPTHILNQRRAGRLRCARVAVVNEGVVDGQATFASGARGL